MQQTAARRQISALRHQCHTSQMPKIPEVATQRWLLLIYSGWSYRTLSAFIHQLATFKSRLAPKKETPCRTVAHSPTRSRSEPQIAPESALLRDSPPTELLHTMADVEMNGARGADWPARCK